MARNKKLNEIPLDQLNEELTARAEVMASDMVLEHITQPGFVRHPMARVRVQTVIEGESMTHQAHAESCDINNIIRQFDRTGLLPPPTRKAAYVDVSNLNKNLTELYADMQNIGERIQAAQAEIAKQKDIPKTEPKPEPKPDPEPTSE